VDEDGFNQAMAEQKKRAKSAWKGSGETDVAGLFTGLLEAGVESEFVGYDQLEAVSTVTALTDLKGRPVERLIQGEAGYAVFAVTPFYGESGGQVGDVGAAQSMTGNLTVADAVKPGPELTVHKIHVDEGEILPRQEITLNVDRATRAATQRNHTTTHLLHTALRNVLGSHVKQSGSLVGPNRLRFDFTHIQAMTPEEIRAVEREVNQAIVDDHPVGREYMDYEAAVEAGAMALFGEKYGGEVCVVSVPGVSTELCGGTHLARTGEAGSFLVLSESGLAAGVRRIEAATGLNALHAAQGYRDAAAGIEAMLKARPGEAADKVAALQKEAKALRKENEKLQAKALSGAGRSLMDEARDVDGVKVLTARLEGASVKALREQMDDIRSKMPSGVACLGTAGNGKVNLILYVSKDLHDRFTAPQLIKDAAALVDGSGGGRADLAQAGGQNPEGLDAALARVEELVGG
jgi:alanyl-tRNA synthetase